MKTFHKLAAATAGALGAVLLWRRHKAEPASEPAQKRTSAQLRAESSTFRTAAASAMGALSAHTPEERQAQKARWEASADRLDAEAQQAEREGR